MRKYLFRKLNHLGHAPKTDRLDTAYRLSLNLSLCWHSQGVPETQYAVKVGDFQWVRIPPGQSVARPEATRATKEVTNSLKYSGKGHLG